MPLFAALMSIDEVEGVDSILPSEDRAVGIKLKCSGCNEVSKKYIYIDPSEEVEVKGGGIRQMAVKCAFCSSQITGNIVSFGKHVCVPSDSSSENGKDRNANEFLFTVDIRNGEPVELELDDQWVVVAKSGARFQNADLSQDWCDFDEQANESLAVLGVSVNFRKIK